MLIDEAGVEPLKKRLTVMLEPITDADPKVLSEYVVALLKHDHPEAQLKQTCIEQLVDFLAEETGPFVDKLFQMISADSPYQTTRGAGPPTISVLHSQFDTNNNSNSAAHHHQHHNGGRGSGRRHMDGAGGSSSGGTYNPRESINNTLRKAGAGAPYSQQRHYGRNNNSENGGRVNMSQQQQNGSEHQHRSSRNTPYTRTNATGSSQQHERQFDQRKRGKCFDYEEKGVCTRGEHCPYDHGSAAQIVIAENTPDLGNGAGGPQRSFAGHKRQYHSRPNFAQQYGDPSDTSNSKLVIENIPPEYLVLDAVNEYFKRFGSIVNITMVPQCTRAIVEYSSHIEAQRAYQNPDVIFGNRFVKVFFARSAEHLEQLATQQQQHHHQQQQQDGESAMLGPKIDRSLPPEAAAAQAAMLARQKMYQDMANRAAALRKEREKMLESLQAQRQLLETKIGQTTGRNAEAVSQLLANVNRQISEVEVSLAEAAAPVAQQSTPAITSGGMNAYQDREKQRLDRELDMLNTMKNGAEDGNDSFDNVMDFNPVYNTGSRPIRGRGGGSHASAYPRAFANVRHNATNTKLLVKNLQYPESLSNGGDSSMAVDGAAADEQRQAYLERIKLHFSNISPLTSFDVSEDGKAVIADFTDRAGAEKAANSGAIFEGKTLHLSWFVPPPTQTETESTAMTTSEAPGDGDVSSYDPPKDDDEMRSRYKR